MKKIKDLFSYGVGHGAIGLSCSHLCKYFEYNQITKERKCLKFNLMLNRIFLSKTGSINGEFFCNQYENLKDKNHYGAHDSGLKEFNQIKNELEENILYNACGEEYLQSFYFSDL